MIRTTLSFFLLLLLVPQSINAASLTFVPVGQGSSFSVEVRLAPEAEHLNTVEGTIHIPDGLSVTRIGTGGSALALWTVPPTFSRSDRTVTFVGGVPGEGLAPDANELLFTMYLVADASGSYTLTPEAVSGFRADGTGTRVAVDAEAGSVSVDASSESPRLAADHSAPQGITAVVGSDASLFDGASFVSFYASDEGTGVVSFQLKEGWLAPYQAAERYYVLADQSGKTPVWVRAVDAAGNTRTSHVEDTGGIIYWVLLWFPVAFVLVVGISWWRRIRR